ncbi:MAG: 4Fe-4S ferredoxin [Clostridiales bacterium]|jgi:sulfhydrogenase subunit beta (sulfur reductase)|nr:4Fe-4S ferredoxin [Clostridiales bacterium]OPZ68096.1 MAG: Anaerobic sulfite reductase subunit A [Firmicutes bacterium ADurb.Bin467]
MLKLHLDRLFRIAERRKLFAPIRRAGVVDFGLWEPGADVDLETLTSRSAKGLFFPQSEDLMVFQMRGKAIEVEPAAVPDDMFVLFGVRACDARSFAILDRVFLEGPVDTWYQARRSAGTVVALGCPGPLAESCFCPVFGIDLAEPEGDARAWVLDGELYLKAMTEKGEALLKELDGEEVDDNALDAAKADARAKMAQNPLADLDLTGLDGDHMMEMFNAPEWKALSKACLGCGACTYVCPTCQCYDIRDFDTGSGIQRFRCWDSCMFSDFTLMAHGNPRRTQLERFRQRFMHKLSYFPANNDGIYACVGCGRCVGKCPMHVNIAKVIRALGGKHI